MSSLPAPLSHPWFEARFFCEAQENGGCRYEHEDGRPVTFVESQGLMVWCPCGFGNPRYPIDGGRPHAILVPFSNPPSGIPLPATFGPKNTKGDGHPRWSVKGTGLQDLMTTPSIDVGDDHCWHGFITNGQVR